MPIVLDLYATAHSRLGATTADYIDKSLRDGLKTADGVMIYTHRALDVEPEKRNIIRELFREHSFATYKRSFE